MTFCSSSARNTARAFTAGSTTKQTYQGAELPIWLLAGWAIFILWAIIYLMSGLPSAL
jgi:tryptophan-rich sensory protein